MHVCRIVARNYLPYARVLAASHQRVHPNGTTFVLVLDGDDVEDCEARDRASADHVIMRPSDLDLDVRDFHEMAAMYDVTELATALKPWLLLRLLRDHEVVTYLDPDIVVLGELVPIANWAAGFGLVLTPHSVAPLPRDGRSPSESDLLLAGAFNLGFVSVSRAGEDFLQWWKERLRTDCIVATDQGLFVDQRWVDLAVHYFPHYIVREAGYNVAYWNLDSRKVTFDGDIYRANGEPLRFFHFSGFRPDTPTTLTRHHVSDGRVGIEQGSALARLCEDYAASLRACGWGSPPPYGLGHSVDGVPLTFSLRRAYRTACLNGVPPPDPFDASTAGSFLAWASAERRRNRAATLSLSLRRGRGWLRERVRGLHTR